jgi:SAM-dependent methyltransferase
VTEPGQIHGSRSPIGRRYDRLVARLCGRGPVYPWHFQWLAVAALYRDLRRVLPEATGRVLDVGCGDKPYARWLVNAREHIGLDVYRGPAVDVVVEPNQPWPFPQESFDALLCTQVLEHVADFDHVIREMRRVLKPAGLLVVSVPFAFNEHGAPHDYRRFSTHGLRLLFEGDYEIQDIRREGGVASTCIVLLMNWLDTTMDLWKPTRILKGVALPVWIVFAGLMNVIGVLLDKLDTTGAFYGNVLLLARKVPRRGGG